MFEIGIHFIIKLPIRGTGFERFDFDHGITWLGTWSLGRRRKKLCLDVLAFLGCFSLLPLLVKIWRGNRTPYLRLLAQVYACLMSLSPMHSVQTDTNRGRASEREIKSNHNANHLIQEYWPNSRKRMLITVQCAVVKKKKYYSTRKNMYKFLCKYIKIYINIIKIVDSLPGGMLDRFIDSFLFLFWGM